MSMGLASGYPMDAVITCKFRKNNLCSAVEAERLLAFTNTADPLFMFGAVAVGMFSRPELGATLALAHYLGSLLVGILYRFHGRGRDSHARASSKPAGNILRRAVRELYRARCADGRAFGRLLGDAVKASMQTILLIGGFIILFSVFLRILAVVGVMDHINAAAALLLRGIGFQPSLAPALGVGLFEIDLGALAASQAGAPLNEKIAVVSAIIAWSGLSVHGQVASIVIESGIRMTPYMIARFLHAIFAALLSLLFLGPWRDAAGLFILPVASFGGSTPAYWLARLEQSLYPLCTLLFLLLAISLAIHLLKSLWRALQK